MNGRKLIIDENLFKEGKNLPTIRNYQNLDFLLEIEIIRKLPIFNKLSFEDKICLFRENIQKLVTISNSFNSVQIGSTSIKYPNGLCPGDLCKNIFQQKFYGEEIKRYNILKRRAFIDIITEFKLINLTKEEYILLKLILFCNSIPDNINQNSKNLLKLEAENYSQILLKYLQNNLGNLNGAMRYAECLLFIGKIGNYNKQQNLFYKFIDEKIFNGQFKLIIKRPIFVTQCLS